MNLHSNYSVWCNPILTPGERRFAEKCGVGALWDTSIRCQRKGVSLDSECNIPCRHVCYK
jgi:hypothetical protein